MVTMDKSGKVGGVVAGLHACFDWLCSVPMQKWVSVVALIGGFLYIISSISAYRRNTAERILAEKQLEELDNDNP